MRLAFYTKLGLAVLASILIGRLTPQQGIQALETSLAGAIGAIVGGVIAALAFAFVVLAQLFKSAHEDDPQLPAKYRSITQSLLSDIQMLIWCLAAAIFLPLIRNIDIPLISLPIQISIHFSKEQIITSLEVFLAITSISVLFEICHCMFQVFIADSFEGKKP